jgi:hypothetical protein
MWLTQVLAFVCLGLDHVVANMFFIPIAIFVGDPSISIGFYIWKSMIPTLIGNIIGGGFFVGAAYWYLVSILKAGRSAEVLADLAFSSVLDRRHEARSYRWRSLRLRWHSNHVVHMGSRRAEAPSVISRWQERGQHGLGSDHCGHDKVIGVRGCGQQTRPCCYDTRHSETARRKISRSWA